MSNKIGNAGNHQTSQFHALRSVSVIALVGAVLITLVTVTVAIIVFGKVEEQIAEGESQIRSLNLVSEALIKMNDDAPNYELAALLGIRALQSTYTPQAENMLYRATEQLNIVHVLGGHVGRVLSAVFSPDGRFILTAGDDGTARIWDATTFSEVRVLGSRGGV
ncbi:MAG: hypothetical protein JNJ61_29135, partial [Anaerolineae bacterium]|nr:hypothetical protein [Anaerolineae bacterium]